MTAIFGRMATYSGKELKYEDALNSKIALADFDKLTSLNDEAPVQPDPKRVAAQAEGSPYAIPTPGVTKTV